MEAHAGTITITTPAKKPAAGRERLRRYLATAKARRRERAIRSHRLRASGISSPSIPGSEHTHLVRRGF
jgi:hypothetical protein